MNAYPPLPLVELIEDDEIGDVTFDRETGLFWDNAGHAFRQHEGLEGEFLYEPIPESEAHERYMGTWTAEDRRADYLGTLEA